MDLYFTRSIINWFMVCFPANSRTASDSTANVFGWWSRS